MIRSKAIVLAVCAAAMAVGCTPRDSRSGQMELRVALLPVVDSMPFHVAVDDGLFAEMGVSVELLSVNSPINRDQLLQTGEADIVLAELLLPPMFNRIERQVVTIATVRRPSTNHPLFRILARPGTTSLTAAGLAGVPVGVSRNSVIEYVTDRVLAAEGVPPHMIVTEGVPVIPERFQLLMAGRIPAATLPDPLAQAAIEAGAVELATDERYALYSQSVLVASVAVVESEGEAVEAFLRAWNAAARRLNDQPGRYRNLVFESIAVPDAVREQFQLTPFAVDSIPSVDEVTEAHAWLLDKSLVEAAPSYESVVWMRPTRSDG